MHPKTILDYVGNTPLVEISRLSPKAGVRYLRKAGGPQPLWQHQGPRGSLPGREAEERGELTPGRTLVEASTGNTALALALIAKQRGYGLKVVMLRRTTPGVAELLASFGVEVVWCEPMAGMKGAIELAERLSREEGAVQHAPVRELCKPEGPLRDHGARDPGRPAPGGPHSWRESAPAAPSWAWGAGLGNATLPL